MNTQENDIPAMEIEYTPNKFESRNSTVKKIAGASVFTQSSQNTLLR